MEWFFGHASLSVATEHHRTRLLLELSAISSDSWSQGKITDTWRNKARPGKIRKSRNWEKNKEENRHKIEKQRKQGAKDTRREKREESNEGKKKIIKTGWGNRRAQYSHFFFFNSGIQPPPPTLFELNVLKTMYFEVTRFFASCTSVFFRSRLLMSMHDKK